MPKHELDRLAIGLMVVFCSIWGLQQVAIKVANAGISPVWQAGIRSLGATATILLWVLFRRVKLFERDGTWWPGLLVGLLFSGEFALIFLGLNYTPASRGVIFLYTAPFFVALGARWFLPGERMRRAQWGGMALAFIGVVLLFGEHLWLPADQAWIGDLMILGAAMLWAATTLAVKASALGRSSAEKILLYQLAISAVLLPPLSIAMGEPGVFAPTPLVWANLFFQAVIVAGASYLGWFWLIRHYPATRLSSFSFLTPVMGVLASVLLLDEPLTPTIFAALFLVGAGIWIANRPA
ncbi:MAG: DMT family transporter [Chromatiaceae bacterium]|nr:DMT family transporter [Chromatiaceae bacterium]MBP6733146.1 DMT family transporter [Chromatiaceae bacterium]MBP9602527.1 DMT family transporter [Chromatiaceae bacterium]